MKKNNLWLGAKHFEQKEFECSCGCGFNAVDSKLVHYLDIARDFAGVPFKINSACRCSKHNEDVMGSPSSSHLKGMAADIAVLDSLDRYSILSALMSVGFKRIGVYKNFIHVDVDNSKLQNVIWYK